MWLSCVFPINCRWNLASLFVPLWSVCLAQKDQKMVERGLCIRGGMCSTFRLMMPLHFPRLQVALHRLSHPWSKGGTTGPLSAVLAQSPMGGGECGCSGAMRSLPHFWCPGVWEGRRSICFWFPPPEWPGTGFETTKMHWTLVDLQAFAGPQTQSSVSITPRQSSLHIAAQGYPDLWPLWWQSPPTETQI